MKNGKGKKSGLKQVDFFRYYFNKKVCAAVSVGSDNNYYVGFSFKHPCDNYDKSRARMVAQSRLNNFPVVIDKKLVDNLGSIFLAICSVIVSCKKEALHYAKSSCKLTTDSKKVPSSVYSEYAVRKVREKYDIPYWAIRKFITSSTSNKMIG